MIKYLTEYNITGWIHQMQFSIYQLDFAFPEYKLCVEIDGSTHLQKKVIEIDKRRDDFLRGSGWKTLRISAKDINNNIYTAINKILQLLDKKKIEIPSEFLTKQYYKEQKIREAREEKNKKEQDKLEKINNRIQLILNSKIDFLKIGWMCKVSIILNITHPNVKRFMKKNMQDFYETCYHR